MAKKENIIKVVTEHYHLSIDEIKTHTRKWEILSARQTLQYLLVKCGDCSQREAGEITGGYSRRAVSKNIKAVENLRDTNKTYRKSLTALILALQDIDLHDFCTQIINTSQDKEIIQKAHLIIKTL